MAEGNNISSRVARLDSETPAPEERARVIWELIRSRFPDLTDWDLLCFCVNYIAMQSQQWNWLEAPAKELNRLVYIAHYVLTEEHDLSSRLKRNESRDREHTDRDNQSQGDSD